MNDQMFYLEVFHATPAWNFAPIIKRGIDPKMSRGQLPVAWYCAEHRIDWCIRHVAEKYRCDIEDVIVFGVENAVKAWFFIAPQPDTYRTGKLLRPTAVYPSYMWFPELLERK